MDKKIEKIEDMTSVDCGIEYTLSVMSGKWKPFILWFLAKQGTKRYGEIRKFIPDVTNKMLAQQLKELTNDKLIKRKDYHQIPPKVEYSLSKRGESLLPMLDFMCIWGYENKK